MPTRWRFRFGLLALLAVVSACAVVFAVIRQDDKADAKLDVVTGNAWTYCLRPSRHGSEFARMVVLVRSRKVRRLGPGEAGSVGIEHLGSNDADETSTCVSVEGAGLPADKGSVVRIEAIAAAPMQPVRIACSLGKSTGSVVATGTVLDGTTNAIDASWNDDEMHLVNIWTRDGDTQYVHDIVLVRESK